MRPPLSLPQLWNSTKYVSWHKDHANPFVRVPRPNALPESKTITVLPGEAEYDVFLRCVEYREDGASAEERLDAAMPLLYRVRFDDGHEHDVFEDELLISPAFFSAECGPPPASEIADARRAREAPLSD